MNQIKQAPSPNFTPGRGGYKIIAIVNHITAGSFPGCLSWLCDTRAKASAHYMVTRAGEIYQLVKDSDTAWHAGRVDRPTWGKIIKKAGIYINPNKYTLGIEHEGQPYQPLTEAQYQATLWLHKLLVKKYNIPVDDDHIIGHYRIYAMKPNCPGRNFPWERLFDDLGKGR